MTPYYQDAAVTIYHGDALTVLQSLPAESVQCCVTSPPYWGLRDYGVSGQLGLERTPEEYVAKLVVVFREVRRVLRDDGTVWLNLGDSYCGGGRGCEGKGWEQGESKNKILPSKTPSGLKPKDLIGIPWRVAFALQADGWYLRSDIIWSKPNPMPESVTDRPTKSHEYIFLLTKSARYFFDADAVREPMESGPSDIRKMVEGRERIGGMVKDLDDHLAKASRYTNIGQKRSVGDPSNGRNIRTVWTIATAPYPEAHFATFPRKLVEPCILAGCPVGGVVLDPFSGAGTALWVAKELGRHAWGIELNAAYIDMSAKRMAQEVLPL